MLYLGTARLWYQERYEKQPTEQRLDNSAFSRLSGYDDCLSATSNYKQFEQWYSWLWLSYREHQITQLESPSAKLKEGVRVQRMKEAIQAIQQAINCLTQQVTGWHDLEYSASHNQQLVMSHPQYGKIPYPSSAMACEMPSQWWQISHFAVSNSILIYKMMQP